MINCYCISPRHHHWVLFPVRHDLAFLCRFGNKRVPLSFLLQYLTKIAFFIAEMRLKIMNKSPQAVAPGNDWKLVANILNHIAEKAHIIDFCTFQRYLRCHTILIQIVVMKIMLAHASRIFVLLLSTPNCLELAEKEEVLASASGYDKLLTWRSFTIYDHAS